MKEHEQFSWGVIILTVVLLIGLFLSGICIYESQQRQTEFSSYSVKSEGFFVTYKLLEHLFPGKVHRNSSTFSQLIKDQDAVIITSRTQWTGVERKTAFRWMKKGGVLILLSPMPEDLGSLYPSRKAVPNSKWPGFLDLPIYFLPPSKVINLRRGDQAVYYSKYGAEVVVRPVGRGRRIVFSNPMINESLSKHPEGAAILGKLVAVYLKDHSLVLWDEGFSTNEDQRLKGMSIKNSKTKEQAFLSVFLAIMAQILLVAILYALTRGKRFGNPIELDNRSELTLRDYILSLTGFYYRAGARLVVIEELYTDLRRRLLRIAGLHHTVSNESLADAVSRVVQINAKVLCSLLNEAKNILDKEILNERGLYRLGRQMHQIRREIEKYGIHY